MEGQSFAVLQCDTDGQFLGTVPEAPTTRQLRCTQRFSAPALLFAGEDGAVPFAELRR